MLETGRNREIIIIWALCLEGYIVMKRLTWEAYKNKLVSIQGSIASALSITTPIIFYLLRLAPPDAGFLVIFAAFFPLAIIFAVFTIGKAVIRYETIQQNRKNQTILAWIAGIVLICTLIIAGIYYFGYYKHFVLPIGQNETNVVIGKEEHQIIKQVREKFYVELHRPPNEQELLRAYQFDRNRIWTSQSLREVEMMLDFLFVMINALFAFAICCFILGEVLSDIEDAT